MILNFPLGIAKYVSKIAIVAICSNACGIKVSDNFVITGGSEASKRVILCDNTGCNDELPEMNQGRQGHGCSSYSSKDGEVGFSPIGF